MKNRKKKVQGGDAAEWLEEQYLKTPGYREEIAEMVAAMELESGLVALREHRGVYQRELARMLGVSQPVVARLEAGRAKDMKMSTLMRYARALGGRINVEIKRDSKWAKVVPLRRAVAGG